MKLQPVKIGKHTLRYPIIQGGMGVGISWSNLAGSVSKEGALGVISSIGTGNYQNRRFVKNFSFDRPSGTAEFYNRGATFEIFKKAREICGDAPLGANILQAINDYERVVIDTCEAGADIIITGAGLPMNMPEYAADFPDVALIPIVSSSKALCLIAKRWEQRFKRVPDAVVLEGPLSGGHQGFTYEQCIDPEYQLEKLIAPVVAAARSIDASIPVFAAGGIWDHDDIARAIELGASGVQMGTRFIGTFECDAPDIYKRLLLDCTADQIKLISSPVGYPARAIRTPLIDTIDRRDGLAIRCVSNCVVPCKRGEEAKKVGYCIADRLSDAAAGILETGLFFSGSNGHRIDKIISVHELMQKLVNGEEV
ncbi:MAG: nitronate monooxygenase family protein [Helicobacteraceae bacterium]|nr:nitronate monooxygenase family protein [Helicobacteraceae bacterium]